MSDSVKNDMHTCLAETHAVNRMNITNSLEENIREELDNGNVSSETNTQVVFLKTEEINFNKPWREVVRRQIVDGGGCDKDI